MGKNIVWRLLRHNIKVGQLLGYAIANLVGLAIVLTALQFYRDVTNAESGDDAYISRDYLIISKRVEGLGSLLGGEASFAADEVADVEAQPWAARVGRFTSSGYDVSASIDMAGRHMSTALFFESIPDEFFDLSPAGWTFDPTEPEIPIIISKDYLTLYNFGFASSRGLPQLSEAMIGMVSLTVSISGNGRQQYFPARIVGFSSRLNTIAVPEEFMQWANSRFSSEPAADPSRLIIEVSSLGDPAIDAYMSSHGYEVAGDKASSSRTAYFLTIVTSVVVAVGTVISLLALFILLLSIYLLLQKNRATLRDLMLLGYSPRQVAAYYYRIVLAVNVVVLAASVVSMLVARSLWQAPLASLGLSSASPLPGILCGVIIVVVISIINMVAISRNVTAVFVENRSRKC